MCGIIGVAGPNLDPYTDHTLHSMVSTLSHRGPDGFGISKPHGCILGHTRLAIIDIADGTQPMNDPIHNLTITFNGEIYNYQSLRKHLIARGHTFTTHSDTEVILKAYAEYGPDCVSRLEGMFAFGIWNHTTHSLFLARDRFGKKPLYYAYDTLGNLIFASEIKALFASGYVQGTLDYKAIDAYFHLMYIPPHETVYTNIFTLPAAHHATYTGRILKPPTRYWSLNYSPIHPTKQDAKEHINELLTRSITQRLVADVEIGSFLSGGVDSSIVTYLAQQQSPHTLKTFSAGFSEYINELPYAQTAAHIAGTDHYELQIANDIPSILTQICAHFDEPLANSSIIPQYLISQFASEKVKVVLSGDGGDELFLGYPRYWKQINTNGRARFMRALKRKGRDIIFPNLYHDSVTSLAQLNRFERLLIWNELRYADVPFMHDFYDSTTYPLVQRINTFDINMWLPGGILNSADRTSMMHGLEVRSPFLDHTLAEYVFNLPDEYKTDHVSGKLILKEMFSGIFGNQFLNRPKQGFSSPMQKWFAQDDFRELFYDTFMNNNAQVYSFLNKRYIQYLVRQFYEKQKTNRSHRLWLILCLELWLDAHKKHQA